MPMPDSVSSFVELSIHPSKLLDALEEMSPPGAFRAGVDKLSERIKNAGQIDLRKDILAHLGPRMVVYLAPGRSAAANDDSLESALKNGVSGMAAVTAMQSYFPKFTLVAEVNDHVAFGKALDTMIIAINSELEAQARAMEEEEEQKTAETEKAESPDRGRGKRAGGRSERKRDRRVLAPRFTPVLGESKSFVLITPSESKLRFGPPRFRPTICLQGKYVAFATSTDAAQAAVVAAARKDWKPSSEIDRVCEHVPSKLVMLSVTDSSEGLSSLLASLPGTLQTTINTTIALSKARANGALASGTGGSAPGMASGGIRAGSSAGMGSSMPGMGGPPGGKLMRRGGVVPGPWQGHAQEGRALVPGRWALPARPEPRTMP